MAEKKIVDARGSFCPGPLMELIAAIKMVEVGDEIEVLSSDKGSAAEIPQWIPAFFWNHEKRTGPEVSPRIFPFNQQLKRRLKEQCAHDAVIPHGLRSQRRPHHARDRSIAKVPG